MVIIDTEKQQAFNKQADGFHDNENVSKLNNVNKLTFSLELLKFKHVVLSLLFLKLSMTSLKYSENYNLYYGYK